MTDNNSVILDKRGQAFWITINRPEKRNALNAEVIAGIDLTDRRVIVTGGSSGIGMETARALASAGAEVTLAVRNVAAGERAATDMSRGVTGELHHVDGGYNVVGMMRTDAAAELAERQGTQHQLVPIADVVDAYQSQLKLTGLAEENLQARVRGTALMALSNQYGHLILTTGNKSEMATGYATLYGDMAGGFAVIKDVPKTLVYALCADLNERAGRDVIPRAVIEKPPSAELAPGQLDSDSLPPYDVLDPIIEGYVEDDLSVVELIARGHDEELTRRVARMIDRNEYKRRQAAPGVRVSPKAFGKDRRLPITNRWPG